MKPQILDLNKENDKKLFSDLKEKNVLVVDEIEEQMKELRFVKEPRLLSDPGMAKKEEDKVGTVWIYYPWRNALVHCLNKDDFKLLRKSRNMDLINEKEQQKLEKIRVGIAGLNVGNPGAVCLALEGDIEMKLTDNDVLSLSNLNRFRAGLPDLGLNKAVLTARQIYEINPFAELEVFSEGVGEKNLEEFLLKPKLDILIEEMDNVPLKIRIRELASNNQIPVIMVTGSGPDVIIDVERYDLDPNLPIMNGYLKKEVIDGIKKGPASFREKMELARDFMGAEYLHPRLVDSFLRVGSSLAGIPQIAESSFLRGAAIAYFTRQIAQGEEVKSGRYYLKLSDVN